MISEEYLKLLINICQRIKEASNHAFAFDLMSAPGYDCQGRSSYIQMEDSLRIIYYIYMDTVDFELKHKGAVLQHSTEISDSKLNGIPGSELIISYVQSMSFGGSDNYSTLQHLV